MRQSGQQTSYPIGSYASHNPSSASTFVSSINHTLMGWLAEDQQSLPVEKKILEGVKRGFSWLFGDEDIKLASENPDQFTNLANYSTSQYPEQPLHARHYSESNPQAIQYSAYNPQVNQYPDYTTQAPSFSSSMPPYNFPTEAQVDSSGHEIASLPNYSNQAEIQSQQRGNYFQPAAYMQPDDHQQQQQQSMRGVYEKKQSFTAPVPSTSASIPSSMLNSLNRYNQWEPAMHPLSLQYHYLHSLYISFNFLETHFLLLLSKLLFCCRNPCSSFFQRMVSLLCCLVIVSQFIHRCQQVIFKTMKFQIFFYITQLCWFFSIVSCLNIYQQEIFGSAYISTIGFTKIHLSYRVIY
jgi:hypothetical protein